MLSINPYKSLGQIHLSLSKDELINEIAKVTSEKVADQTIKNLKTCWLSINCNDINQFKLEFHLYDEYYLPKILAIQPTLDDNLILGKPIRNVWAWLEILDPELLAYDPGFISYTYGLEIVSSDGDITDSVSVFPQSLVPNPVEFVFAPKKGVGPVKFNMSDAQIHEILGGPSYSDQSSRTQISFSEDYFDDIGITIEYNHTKKCQKISLYNNLGYGYPIKLTYQGFNMINRTCWRIKNWLEATDSSFTYDNCCYYSQKLGISFCTSHGIDPFNYIQAIHCVSEDLRL